jgi:hypothetical protein
MGNTSDFILNLPTSYKNKQNDFSAYIKQKIELLNSSFCKNNMSTKMDGSQTSFRARLFEEVKKILFNKDI